MPVNLLLLRSLIAAVGAGIGAYTDFKTGYIYDKLTYPLIAAGALLTLFSFDLNLMWLGFSSAVFIYAAGFVLEYLGHFGGGDVKLFVALALLLPLEWKFGVPLVFVVFVLASLLQVVWVPLYYGGKYLLEVKKKSLPLNKLVLTFVILVFFTFYLSFLTDIGVISLAGSFILFVPLALGSLYSVIERDVLNNLFAKELPLRKLEDGDVLSSERNSSRVLKAVGVKKVIDKNVIKKLKKMKIKSVVVFKTGPKFGPAIFVALLITLLFPKWYSFILLL